MSVAAIVFWVSIGLIVYAQLGYGLLLVVWAGLRGSRGGGDAAGSRGSGGAGGEPVVSLIVAAHDEQEVIGAKVADALALDWPRERLEVIVCCDGCTDLTAARAWEAGADLVLELARGGKVRAQNAGVEAGRGELLAFSDANSTWEPDALRALAGAFEEPEVGYACGGVSFARADGGDNQEGVYWRYELGLRALESRLGSITAGNGAIYATRRDSYIVVDPIMGHDLSLPFKMVKRGWRAVYVAGARAREKMVPTIEGEFARKRRMMSHAWPIVVRGGMLSPRGYGPGYAVMIFSHRILRYASPGLHVVAFAANCLLLGDGPVYVVCLVFQVALLAGAALAGRLPARPLLVARYYVLTTASLALGLWDWLRHGTSAAWEAAEGTR
ncbi:MAG TPA: glycosyltransferase [Solirubrobacteraceae bacterium]|nr:glycosyltransferase [Solirubrobacteraceae bacterium]